jgi:hypothetical protein
MTQATDRPDANQLLLTGGKAPEAADFGSNPPGQVAGKVLGGPTTYHAREFDRNNPGQGPLRYWPDNNPVYGVYIDLDTAQGMRRLYVEKQRMTTAIQQAMLRAHVRGIEIDGYLVVTWTGTETGQGNMPANTYTAEYTPPGAQPPANMILSNGGATTPAAQSALAQWQQPAPSATHPGYAPQATQTYSPPTPAPAAPVAPAPTTPSHPVLTETIAAAMRNAGIPTDGYLIVPG